MADKRRRIYYPKGAILEGQYTSGGELMFKDGTEYIGQYHYYKNTKELFSEPNYVDGLSVRLIPYANIGSDSSINRVFAYNTLKEIEADDYSLDVNIPDPFFPNPSAEDYEIGFITRYFMKHKGNNTIFEVSKDGFAFDSVYYQKLELKWKISGVPTDVGIEKGVLDTNRRTINLYKNDFIGLERYLTNLSQFYIS